MEVCVKLGTLADLFLTYVIQWLGGIFSNFMKKFFISVMISTRQALIFFWIITPCTFWYVGTDFCDKHNSYFNEVENLCSEEVRSIFLEAVFDGSPPLQQRRTFGWCSFPWQNSRRSVSCPLLFLTCGSPTPELFLPLVSQHMLWICNYLFRST
jgi:hypothetical protein